MIKFTIQRDGTITDAIGREAERLRRRSTSPRCARSSATRQLPPLPAQFPNPTLTVHLEFRIPTMTRIIIHRIARSLRRSRRRWRRRPRAAAAAAAAAARRRSSRARSATTISGEGGAPPRLAVPDFIALVDRRRDRSRSRKTIGQVLWDDLNFEREFALSRATSTPRFRRRRRSTTCRSIAGAS